MQLAENLIVADRYRLVRRLNEGGMGSVWVAHDQLLDAPCALKLIDNERRENEEVRVRLRREAKAAARLRGPNVVDVFDHGMWDGIPFIAMELLEGEDLGARLDRDVRLDFEATHRIIAQVARALTRAHAMGIIHRDLKPENIFLVPTDDGDIAKVLDFGIARQIEYSLKDKTTKTGSFLGTPYYMSPEQARGESVDYRSDLWSLGVIVYQCLTGRSPFESEALGALLGQIMYEPIPVPSSVKPDLPPALDEWWLRAASRDREQRFQSAKELSDALAVALSVRQPLTVPSVPPRATQTSINDDSYVGPTPTPLPVPTRPKGIGSKRRPGIATPHSLSRTRWSVDLPLKKLSKKAWLGIAASVLTALLVLGLALRERAPSSGTLQAPREVARAPAAALPPALPAEVPPPMPEPLPTPEPILSVDQLPKAENPPGASANKPGTLRRPKKKKSLDAKLKDSADYGI